MDTEDRPRASAMGERPLVDNLADAGLYYDWALQNRNDMNIFMASQGAPAWPLTTPAQAVLPPPPGPVAFPMPVGDFSSFMPLAAPPQQWNPQPYFTLDDMALVGMPTMPQSLPTPTSPVSTANEQLFYVVGDQIMMMDPLVQPVYQIVQMPTAPPPQLPPSPNSDKADGVPGSSQGPGASVDPVEQILMEIASSSPNVNAPKKPKPAKPEKPAKERDRPRAKQSGTQVPREHLFVWEPSLPSSLIPPFPAASSASSSSNPTQPPSGQQPPRPSNLPPSPARSNEEVKGVAKGPEVVKRRRPGAPKLGRSRQYPCEDCGKKFQTAGVSHYRGFYKVNLLTIFSMTRIHVYSIYHAIDTPTAPTPKNPTAAPCRAATNGSREPITCGCTGGRMLLNWGWRGRRCR